MKILLSVLIFIIVVMATGCAGGDAVKAPVSSFVVAQDEISERIIALEGDMATAEEKIAQLEAKATLFEQANADKDRRISQLETEVAGLKAKVFITPRVFLTPDGRVPVTKEDWLTIPEFVAGLPGYTPKPKPTPTPATTPTPTTPILTTFSVEVKNDMRLQIVEAVYKYLDQNGESFRDIKGTKEITVKMGDNTIEQAGPFNVTGTGSDSMKLKKLVLAYPDIPVVDFYFTLVLANGQTFTDHQTLPSKGIQ